MIIHFPGTGSFSQAIKGLPAEKALVLAESEIMRVYSEIEPLKAELQRINEEISTLRKTFSLVVRALEFLQPLFECSHCNSKKQGYVLGMISKKEREIDPGSSLH